MLALDILTVIVFIKTDFNVYYKECKEKEEKEGILKKKRTIKVEILFFIYVN